MQVPRWSLKSYQLLLRDRHWICLSLRHTLALRLGTTGCHILEWCDLFRLHIEGSAACLLVRASHCTSLLGNAFSFRLVRGRLHWGIHYADGAITPAWCGRIGTLRVIPRIEVISLLGVLQMLVDDWLLRVSHRGDNVWLRLLLTLLGGLMLPRSLDATSHLLHDTQRNCTVIFRVLHALWYLLHSAKLLLRSGLR